jgi:hypothetical protein
MMLWDKARTAAGVPGSLFSTSVGRRRYVIVSHTDIEDALEKLERKKAFETKGIYGSKRKREW